LSLRRDLNLALLIVQHCPRSGVGASSPTLPDRIETVDTDAVQKRVLYWRGPHQTLLNAHVGFARIMGKAHWT
jgi:hypothetical protein